MELCEKKLGIEVLHTLEDLMIIYGEELPIDLSTTAMTDIIEGAEFLHRNGIIATWRYQAIKCFGKWNACPRIHGTRNVFN